MGMTGFYGPTEDEESLRTLNGALDRGCNFWDSSGAYGPHTNERLPGRMTSRERLLFSLFSVTKRFLATRRAKEVLP